MVTVLKDHDRSLSMSLFLCILRRGRLVVRKPSNRRRRTAHRVLGFIAGDVTYRQTTEDCCGIKGLVNYCGHITLKHDVNNMINWLDWLYRHYIHSVSSRIILQL